MQKPSEYLQKFLCERWGCGIFWQHKQAVCDSFLHRNRIFHQFVKVFFLKNFPLSGIYTCCYLQDPDGLYLTKLLLYFVYMCRVVWTMTPTPQPKSSFVSFKDSCFFTPVRTASWVPLTTEECRLDSPDVHVIVYRLCIATFRGIPQLTVATVILHDYLRH